MFLSRAQTELPVDAEQRQEGVRLWSALEFGLDMPWFLATVEFFEDGVASQRCLLTSVAYHLQDGLPPLPGARVVDVSLISPGWLNGAGAWQMARLIEIRSGECEGRELLLYGLADGSWLVENAVPFERVEKQETIFALRF